MSTTLIIVIAGVLGVAGLGALVYVVLSGDSRRSDIRDLMSSTSTALTSSGERRRRTPEEVELDIEKIKKHSGATRVRKDKEDISVKLFKAGFYTEQDRQRFRRARIIAPMLSMPLFPLGMYFLTANPMLTTMAGLIGLFAGYAMPVSWLERQVRARQEDTLYYLPLVIEQVSIGVSSALDVGPCLTQIVQMANERDSHNPVTEMFIHVEKLMRSGLNLEDALLEVAEANGTTEIKHAFMFLAQCSRHGGEVSRQLQELADAVMMQRQTQVEARIASLPVKATGPLVMVFAGFFSLLFAGLFVRILTSFGT